MSEAISISELLNRSTARVKIDRIPTLSRHEKTARNILNDILDQNENFFPCIAALVVYPIQIWAKQTRERLGIDYASLNNEVFFGIATEGRFHDLKHSMEETDREIELVKKILERKPSDCIEKKEFCVLSGIHSDTETNVSKHMIAVHYRNAVLNVCQEYNDSFETLNKEMFNADIDAEFEGVYHNTDLLVRQVDSIFGMKDSFSSGVYYRETHDLILNCIRSLNTFTIDGHIMAIVAEKYAKHIPEYRIAEELCKSRSYVNSKYENAVEILSYLLWGYSTRDILAGTKRKHI